MEEKMDNYLQVIKKKNIWKPFLTANKHKRKCDSRKSRMTRFYENYIPQDETLR